MKKHVGIIGASGLIGSHLAKRFEELGWDVLRMSRSARQVEGEKWAVISKESLEGVDVLINLAGEAIDKRWTATNKEQFYESRVGLTRQLGLWLSELEVGSRPEVWLNASAVGIYGDRGDEKLSEHAAIREGYLVDLCKSWEYAAHEVELEGCRIVHPRIGVVLGQEAHAWLKMKRVFSLGLGGELGNGKQWFPWVHLEDVVEAFVFLASSADAVGAFNIVSPESVRNQEYTRELGRLLRRPTLFRVPRWGLSIVLGEFASALLASQRVIPDGLRDLGYKWRFSELNVALDDLVER